MTINDRILSLLLVHVAPILMLESNLLFGVNTESLTDNEPFYVIVTEFQ